MPRRKPSRTPANSSSDARPEPGVQLTTTDGSRSSQRVGKEVFAEAVASVDESLGRRIERTSNWRKSYIEPIRDVVVAGTRSAKDALRIAADGLDALARHIVFVKDGSELSMRDAFEAVSDPSFQTFVVEGAGDGAGGLTVPYRGAELSGDALLRQLDQWESEGTIEQSATEALEQVVRNPRWLDLSDRYFVLLGAASEMGPLSSLCAWRANIIAVDLPRPRLWEQIVTAAKQGSGHLFVPTRGKASDPTDLVSKAGVDLLTDVPHVARWLMEFEDPFMVGNYVYADGANFVRLAAAVDALAVRMFEQRPGTTLSYLATPTDVLAVSEEIVDGALARRADEQTVIRKGLKTTTGARLFAPNFRETVPGDKRTWGISDCLVPIQGANYALAKSLQRWRAILSREEGVLTSANVAPASNTRSVVKNKMLAAAYRGAPKYGVEIFESETSRALMAALLVHDIRNPKAAANPNTVLDHPFDLFVQGAMHGGIWRLAYEPRSVLPLALLNGYLKRS